MWDDLEENEHWIVGILNKLTLGAPNRRWTQSPMLRLAVYTTSAASIAKWCIDSLDGYDQCDWKQDSSK